jgi:hypothetical protein
MLFFTSAKASFEINFMTDMFFFFMEMSFIKVSRPILVLFKIMEMKWITLQPNSGPELR